MALIESGTVGEALRFGWRELPRYLRKMWLLTGVAIAVAVYVDWKVAIALVPTIYVLGAAIPAMIYLSKERPGANASDLTVLGLLFVALTLLGNVAAFSRLGLDSLSGRYVGSMVLVLVISWLALKLSAAIPMYLLQSKSSVYSACVSSWRFVRAGTWWRFFAFRLAGDLPGIGLYLIVHAERMALYQAGTFLAAIVLVQTLAIVGRLWSSLATVALVSTAPALAANPGGHT